MQLENSFTVPVGVEEAWRVLLDIERIAPCMPGAAVDSVDGDDFTGTVKVKLGPIGLTYKGKASFVEKDAAAHRAVIDARGRDARGNGTAAAKITATLTEAAGATQVDVITDLDITGKPAQFGRGVMADVGNKLIGQFAECLARQLTAGAGDADTTAGTDATNRTDTTGGGPAVAPAATTAPMSTTSSTTSSASPAPPRPSSVAPINLIESAGPALAKRLVPLALGVVVLVWLLRRRRA
jgi:carbon monoxide dehydrogenase subunit G